MSKTTYHDMTPREALADLLQSVGSSPQSERWLREHRPDLTGSVRCAQAVLARVEGTPDPEDPADLDVARAHKALARLCAAREAAYGDDGLRMTPALASAVDEVCGLPVAAAAALVRQAGSPVPASQSPAVLRSLLDRLLKLTSLYVAPPDSGRRVALAAARSEAADLLDEDEDEAEVEPPLPTPDDEEEALLIVKITDPKIKRALDTIDYELTTVRAQLAVRGLDEEQQLVLRARVVTALDAAKSLR